MENKLITIGEAAKILGVTVQTVRMREWKMMIRSIRTSGGHRRYSRAEIEAHRDDLLKK